MMLVLGFAVLSVTGCEYKIVDSMMDGMEGSEEPTKDNPEAYAIALVQSAIDLYNSGGIEAVAAYHNDPANVDGQWYVFITDENDIFVAHAPMPELIGTDLKDVKWHEEDVDRHDGSTLGVSIAKATITGKWIDYLWPNPESGEIEQKRTWAIRHDGYLYGSGYYEPEVSTETDSN